MIHAKVTVRREQIRSTEAELYQEWIDNDRRHRALVAKMREVAAKATELIMKERTRHSV